LWVATIQAKPVEWASQAAVGFGIRLVIEIAIFGGALKQHFQVF
jgi:hypothetical protein